MIGPGELAIALYVAAVGALFGLGMFCVVSRSNLVKMIIGIELMGKAATLAFILGGFLNGDVGTSQGVVFTIIAIEAVVAALALAFAVMGKSMFGTLDMSAINDAAAAEADQK